MSARKRHLLYGLNVGVTVVLAGAVAALAIWAAGSFGGRVDLTRSGVNSLSSRTVQLLQGLDQELTLTGLYSTALKEIRPHAEKYQKRVGDLLDLYETAARGKLTTHMIDASESPAKVTALLTRLAEKPAYKDEAAPHAEVLGAFPELSGRVVELMQGELAELDRLRNADPRAARIRELATVERFFRMIVQEAQETGTDIKTLVAEEIPRYGRAVELVEDYLDQTRKMLQDAQAWMTGNGVNVPGIAQETKEFFAGATERYKAALADLEALLEKSKDLEPVTLEEVY
ncbi:MAG: Gldg family protein, partial [Phycisphaerae bacterium]